MTNRSPIYLVIVLAACGYLFAANLRGWSPLSLLTPKTSTTHGAPIRHK